MVNCARYHSEWMVGQNLFRRDQSPLNAIFPLIMSFLFIDFYSSGSFVPLLGLYSPCRAVGPCFIHAACSLEGVRSGLAFIDLTRAADDDPSSDNP